MINNAQNTGYTFKAGPSMGFQKWANGGKELQCSLIMQHLALIQNLLMEKI